jgi:hypothetical protein
VSDAELQRAIRKAVLDAVEAVGSDVSADDAARLRWLAYSNQPVGTLLRHVGRKHPQVMAALLMDCL